jgi:hypothetical protein
MKHQRLPVGPYDPSLALRSLDFPPRHIMTGRPASLPWNAWIIPCDTEELACDSKPRLFLDIRVLFVYTDKSCPTKEAVC